MQIHLTTADLKTLFAPVLPWAGRDAGLPVLTGVHLTSQDGYLIAEATDRFRLGLRRYRPTVMVTDKGELVPTPGDRSARAGLLPADIPVGLDVIIPVSALRQILDLFRTRRGLLEPIVTLEFTDDTVTASAGLGLRGDVRDLRVTYDLITAEFPNVRRLVTEAIADLHDHTPAVGLNPRLISAFSTAAKALSVEYVQIHVRGPSKPIIGFVGNDFIGILMPRRPFDNSDPRPGDAQHAAGWSAFLTP